MSDQITQCVLNFLRKHMKEDKPILLGLSGGTDSLALFYLLLECQKKIPFSFGVAHIDHGWRPESTRESSILKELAERHSLPFHLKVLLHDSGSSNLEAKCRDERVSFFDQLCRTHGYQAVVLGHHLDDQAETVLKNIFEGSQLSACNGISEVKKLGSLEVWRPLLKRSKKELSQYLEIQGCKPFVDETNFDTKYLRARMRGEIIPYLEEIFGKGIKRSLASISGEAQELQEFLREHLSSILANVNTSVLGSYIDLSNYKSLSLLESKFLIRQVCRIEDCFPSKEIVDAAAALLLQNVANKKFSMGKNTIFIDRMRLFVTRDKIQSLPDRKLALTGDTQFGSWEVKIQPYSEECGPETTCWKEIWEGKGVVFLPKTKEPYLLGLPAMNSSYPRSSSVSKWWNKHKIPSFLRQVTPVVWSGESIVHEFLTGKNREISAKNDCWQKISLIRVK